VGTLRYTPAQGGGPYFNRALMPEGIEHAVPPGSPGALTLSGAVLDRDGNALNAPDALLEFNSTDQFARAWTGMEGSYQITLRKPPADGEFAPSFLVAVHVFAFSEPLYARMYFPDEPANDTDPVLRALDPDRRDGVIARPDGDGLRFDVVLAGDRQTAFIAPLHGPSIANVATPPPVREWRPAAGSSR
jgi:protocatechuate 3,4-dioxygenase alpha subunit